MEKELSGIKIMGKERILRFSMVAFVILINLKYIFVDFGIDAEFQISMSYRLATGDRMFLEMWEPYQMSAFLCTFFIKIYLLLFKTTTGIVLYLQIIGVLIDVAVACFFYRIVSRHLNSEKTAFVSAMIILLVSPKDIPIADYTNMQMWFSLLLCLFLFLHYKYGKLQYLILSALSLCGAVLSYPSCLLLLFGVLFMFFYKKDVKNALIFTGICVLAGCLYIGAIFINISPDVFAEIIKNMLAIETSHSMGIAERLVWYLKDFAKILILLAVVYLAAFGVVRLFTLKEKGKKEERALATDILFLIIMVLVGLYTAICWQKYVRYSYSVVFTALIFLGARHYRKLTEEQRYFYLCGTVISVLQFVSTLLLTNLEFIASVPYLMIGVLASLLPLGEAFKTADKKKSLLMLKKVFVAIAIVGLMFRNTYVIRPMQGDASSVLQIGSVVKSGPAIGIISEYMGPYIQNETIKEWDAYIEDGQAVYLIGGSLDTLGYLYTDTEISAPSLVPTPGYNEAILDYWEMNPEKYPDVIIASCWYGNLNSELKEDSWMMQWIEEEYRPAYYVDGKYWRYYFKR